MAYYDMLAIKKNLEIQPSDHTADTVLESYGEEADAWVDAVMGNTSTLSTTPAIVKHAASNYAAGRYLDRLKDERGAALMEAAEKQLRTYIEGPGRVTVFG